MNQTFINFLISELDSRWDEVSILLDTAKRYEETDQVLHDAICRSVSVLMVAHFEGFYKDLIKNIIEDIKANTEFCDLSSLMQRCYCSAFIDPKSSSETQNKITKLLVQKFKELNVSIGYEPFLFNKNQNPKSQTIVTIFENIGIKKIFEIMETSEYEAVFEEENSFIEARIATFTELLSDYTSAFPYPYERKYFNMDATFKGKRKTLWEEFLEDINRRRNGIAHGSDLGNAHSVENLISTKNKIKCLELALLHVVIEFFGTANSIENTNAEGS